ncbi:type II toxin-antitoxin system RelE/ParE family toxin [Nannocystis pusilla]|uniref:type II toxin-antitoxin system RelE/ParE family toxin n=1 Tax=Nannocystis pusilla TaxID=889268 RepID=UPI003DA54536
MSRYTLKWSEFARVEVRHAIEHYLRQSPTAGARLRDEVKTTLASLREAPNRWAVWRLPDLRRRLLPRFPYALVYTIVDPDQILLLAFLHQHQDPAGRFP